VKQQSLIGAALILGLISPSCVFAQVLPIQQKYIEDGKKNWSWAASAQAVLEYFGVNKSQAEIGDYGTNGHDVPNFLHGNGDLNRHGVDEILLDFGDIEAWGHNSAMAPEKIFLRINYFRAPVLIRWAQDYGDDSNTGPGDRIIVVKGALYRDRTLYLMLMDPIDGTYEKDYDWVVQGAGHIWAESLEIVTRPPFVEKLTASEDSGRIPSLIDLNPHNIDWDGIYSGK